MTPRSPSNDPDQLFDRGNVLMDGGRPEDAITVFDRAIALLKRQLSSTHLQRALALTRLDRHEEALAQTDIALGLRPDYPEGLNRRGGVLVSLRRFEEAIEVLEQALALKPDHIPALANLGLALTHLGRTRSAEPFFARAASLDPASPLARTNHAVCLLKLGEMAAGWRAYEGRHPPGLNTALEAIDAPVWTGRELLQDKSILVLGEQGLGDTIQFARYATRLAQLGARVLFAPQRALAGLMESLGPAVPIVPDAATATSVDYKIRLLSLPLAFGGGLESIPSRTPYLAARPDRIEHWRARLGPQGYKIGVCGQGSDMGVRGGRTFPLAALAPLAAIAGVRLISLQKGQAAAEREGLPPGMVVESPGEGFDDGADAFLDAAAVMTQCDLVVTCDTSVAHLAGALDRPTWIALPKVADWRWLEDRADTPWYPRTRLFRQENTGEWASVFNAMARDLAPLAGGA